jgi:hypothetical protein
MWKGLCVFFFVVEAWIKHAAIGKHQNSLDFYDYPDNWLFRWVYDWNDYWALEFDALI